MSKIIVIGCGAAGMLAAISSAKEGNKVTVIEKNEKAGKKIYITGKGRCNITNACDIEDLFGNIVNNNKFMYSSIYSFTNTDIVDLLEENGCTTKIERGNRVFPLSDKSSDVINTLYKCMIKLGVDVKFNSTVVDILSKNDTTTDEQNLNIKKVTGIIYTDENKNKKKLESDYVVVATGGLSYPSTGSTGDGYKFARKFGHTIKDTSPSLVPVVLKGEEYKKLQGLSLKNVKLTVSSEKKTIYEDQGEMLYTHFGVSGPLVLTASCHILKFLDKPKNKGKDITLTIDMKPAMSFEQLDSRLLRDFKENINRNFKNSLDNLLPKKMISVIIEHSGIDPEKKVNLITREERENLVNCIKKVSYEYAGLGGYNEAIITKGGVNVKEINPSTMESKLVKNLYFAGEVLDVDAYTGGFNLQIAWSTGFLAGKVYE